MDEEKREAVLTEANRLLLDWLEKADEWWPYGFEVGTIGIVYDVELPGGRGIVSISCNDGRDWVKAGLFRAAMRVADGADEDDEGDE